MIHKGFVGFSLGLAIGYVITLLISIRIGDGVYYPVNQALILETGNELNAVLLQSFLWGVMGTGFSIDSMIWDIDSWCVAKRTGVYFITACTIMFPVSYFANWMPHSFIGALIYVSIFLVIFVLVWLGQYFMWKRKAKI